MPNTKGYRRPNGLHVMRSMYNKGCRCDLCCVAKQIEHRLYTYGLTHDQYLALLDKQNNQCGICKADNPNCVDHDHETNRVRGLLCQKCNRALGLFGDNIAGVQRAINYLTEGDSNS